MAHRIEAGVDATASAMLAASVFFCSSKLGLPVLLAAGWAVLVFLVGSWLLGSIDKERTGFCLDNFAAVPLRPEPAELLLDDILSNVVANSRVVRLFDPPAASRPAPPDASHALYDALAQLRRSLR